ncbi:MAG TPA: formate dehydrogenase subunit gamma [Rudaea sp.]|nr:formate dehydrogenase subunit gamma [Rudaea sp.]
MSKVIETIPIRSAAPLPPALPPEQARAVQAALDAHRGAAGALLPVMHAIQDALGYVPEAAVPVIARDLNQSRAEVHGMLSFYHYFRTQPPGRHVVYLCRAEACQSMGARELEAKVKQRLGIDFHETTADGAFTLEPVYCLGNCACAPSVMVDKTLYGRVDAERFEALLVETAEASK